MSALLIYSKLYKSKFRSYLIYYGHLIYQKATKFYSLSSKFNNVGALWWATRSFEYKIGYLDDVIWLKMNLVEVTMLL